MEKEIQLTRLQPHEAARQLAGLHQHDPRGQAAACDVTAIAERGQCFQAVAEKSSAVYVLEVNSGHAWVSACKGCGPVAWRAVLLPVIEQQATGCKSVGFQTARRGLVRAAEKQGYEVTGWILRKKLK